MQAMNWVLVIFVVNFCMHQTTEARTAEISLLATKDQRNADAFLDTIVSRDSTGSDDVRICATTDDVAAARGSLCPSQCSCSPLGGTEVWTKLAVNCSGAQFNESASRRLVDDLTRLLSRCTSNLTDLTITNTPLTTVPDVVCRLTKIRSLNLNNNRLVSLPSNCFTHLVNLTSFRASSNRLTSLQEGVFSNLHQLKTLSLNTNSISFVEPRVFDESSNLSSLATIDLSHNDLTELEPWPVIRAQHRPTSVYLRDNRIRNFTNALQWSFNCSSPRIFDTTLDVHENRIEHISDIIEGWNIEGDDLTSFICFLNAADRDGEKIDLNIGVNPLICDCKDYKIIAMNRAFVHSHLFDSAQCEEPYEAKWLNFPLDELVCRVKELCPPGCSCIKRPNNYSFQVSCPTATLHSLPYRLPDPNQPPPRHGRFDLRFGGSSMKYLESRDYLVNTSRLDVSNSQIETITDDAWRALQRIDWVDLSRNRLTTLPRFLRTENITFRSIALHGNPLSCECDQSWLPDWLRSLGSSLRQPDSVLCHSPDWLDRTAIWKLSSDDYCRNPTRERVLYALKIVLPTVAGAVILVSACFVMVYRCRVKVFAKFNVHPFDVDECRNEDMAFDAFVCCAWPDDALARAIVDRLEDGNVEEGDRGGYRVCYHSRDFPLGGLILRSIQQSIEHSKRVICVLSGAFIDSEFCMLEFRTAWQWNVEHGRHRLIVVKCPGVDEALAAAERDAVAGVDDVRMFLSTYTYIEHGLDDWWQKLHYAMPINRLPAVDADFHHQFFTGDNNDDDQELLLNV